MWKNIPLSFIKFMFSKKARKIDKIFTVDLTVITYCQIGVKILSIFVAFSENVNFTITKQIKLFLFLRLNREELVFILQSFQDFDNPD